MGQRDLRVVLGELARELAAPDPDEITARHDLDALRAEVRAKQPSAPEIHNHVTIAAPSVVSAKPTSSNPPSNRMSLRIPILGTLQARGARAVLIVAVVAGSVALAWLAGNGWRPAAPAGSHAPAAPK